MLKNFVTETANAPGTSSTVTLAGATTGRVAFAQVFATGAQVFYFMDDGSQAEWGVGTLTIGTPNTLGRTTVLGNTAGNTSRLNFAGSTYIYNETPAEKALYTDGSGTAKAPGAVFDPFSGGIPVGAGIDYWVDGPAPPGWIFPYGQQNLSRTIYAALFAKWGTKYGAGDGSTTFGAPDKRDRSSIGCGTMGGTAAGRITTAGAGLDTSVVGNAGGDQMAQAHTHGVTDPGHTHGIVDPGHGHLAGRAVNSSLGGDTNQPVDITGASSSVNTSKSTTGISVQSAPTGITVTSSQSGSAQNLPPGIVCNYIIFAGA